MKPSDWTFRPLDREERAWLHRVHMTRDFPDNELKPLEMLEDLTAKGINTVWGCFSKGQLTGYYVLAQGPDSPMILLDYLAVVPEQRRTGTGSRILQHLKETLTEGHYLFIEAERPDAAKSDAERAIRQRRVAFYQRNGAVISPLRVLLFDVDYTILTLGADKIPSGRELEFAYRSLYRHMLPADRCRAKVHTFLNG